MATPNPSSAYPGFLPPADAAPPVTLYGDALMDIFQETIAGITGVAGSLVRPRWQADPPNQPPFDVDWIAFGVVSRKGDWNAYQRHDPDALDGDGANVLERDEELIILHSFYGPNSDEVQSRYEDGLAVEQNRALLDANLIKLTSIVDAQNVPALIKNKWVRKVDQRAVFRRRIRRVYPVLSVLGADVRFLDNEHYLTEITVSPPAP